MYVQEDKSILGEERLWELTQKLAQKTPSDYVLVCEKGGNDDIALIVVLVCD